MVQTLQSKEHHCQVSTHLTLFPKTKMIDNCHRLNRTKYIARETLSSVETKNTASRKCRAGAKAQHSFRFGLDSLAFNYLIVVLPQAPGFGALRETHGR